MKRFRTDHHDLIGRPPHARLDRDENGSLPSLGGFLADLGGQHGSHRSKPFTDAVDKANSRSVLHNLFVDDTSDWVGALYALNRLAMFDMLPALQTISFLDRNRLENTEGMKHVIGDGALKRIRCARRIVELREIQNDGLRGL